MKGHKRRLDTGVSNEREVVSEEEAVRKKRKQLGIQTEKRRNAAEERMENMVNVVGNCDVLRGYHESEY